MALHLELGEIFKIIIQEAFLSLARINWYNSAYNSKLFMEKCNFLMHFINQDL